MFVSEKRKEAERLAVNSKAHRIVAELLRATDGGGGISFSAKKISAALSIGNSTVDLYLRWMRELGWIADKRGKASAGYGGYRWGLPLEQVRTWQDAPSTFPDFYVLTEDLRRERKEREQASKARKSHVPSIPTAPPPPARKAQDKPVKSKSTRRGRPPLTWTAEERETVATEFALVRMTDPFSHGQKLFLRAQENALPAERRRPSIKLSWEPPEFKELIKREYARLFDDVKYEPIIIEREIPPPPVDVDAVIRSVPLPDLCATAVKRLLTEQSALSSVFSTSRAANSPSALSEQLRGITGASEGVSLPAHREKPKSVPAERKLRIAVITHIETNRSVIRERVPPDVELIFIDRNKSPKSTGVPKTADYLIAHRTSHGWRWMLDNFAPGTQRAIFLRDGIQGVVQKIMELRSTYIAAHNSVRLTAKTGVNR
jgi:hypothetical protein